MKSSQGLANPSRWKQFNYLELYIALSPDLQFLIYIYLISFKKKKKLHFKVEYIMEKAFTPDLYGDTLELLNNSQQLPW